MDALAAVSRRRAYAKKATAREREEARIGSGVCRSARRAARSPPVVSEPSFSSDADRQRHRARGTLPIFRAAVKYHSAECASSGGCCRRAPGPGPPPRDPARTLLYDVSAPIRPFSLRIYRQSRRLVDRARVRRTGWGGIRFWQVVVRGFEFWKFTCG